MKHLFFYEIMWKEKEIPDSHKVRLLAAEVMVAVSEKGSAKMLMGLDGKSLTSQVLRLPQASEEAQSVDRQAKRRCAYSPKQFVQNQ